MTERAAAPAIRFDAKLYEMEGTTLLRLPADASKQLPSRGQVAVEGTINGRRFGAVLEPDGARGHWLRIDDELRRAARVRAGDSVSLEVAPTKDWPEPNVPQDFMAALRAASPTVRYVWGEITPIARWEWVRWVNATANPATRKRRVEVSLSKMNGGKRRPCCFDLASCTDPELGRGGRLREPE